MTTSRFILGNACGVIKTDFSLTQGNFLGVKHTGKIRKKTDQKAFNRHDNYCKSIPVPYSTGMLL